jgi:hypothetical protein
MKKFRVYMTETLEYSYDVEAKSPEEAKDIIYQGDHDEETYEVWDSFDVQIEDVQEIEDGQ